MVDSLFIFSSENMLKDYKETSKFFIKIFYLFILVFILDFSIGYLLRYLYFNQKSGLQYRTTYSLEKTNQDIIILGPSTANHHYIPTIIEDSLNMTCYNTGRDGNGLLYNLAVQNAILKRYKPKLFIVDIRPSLLSDNFNDLERLSSLLPYYENHIEIREIVRKRSTFEDLKLISRIYPFNSSLLIIISNNLNHKKNSKIDYNGYIPLACIIHKMETLC